MVTWTARVKRADKIEPHRRRPELFNSAVFIGGYPTPAQMNPDEQTKEAREVGQACLNGVRVVWIHSLKDECSPSVMYKAFFQDACA